MPFWRQVGFRLAAILIAAVVCGDVTLDAACDPIGLPGPARAAAVSSDSAAGSDACADFCVPDCFCCSRSETPGPALAVPPPTVLGACTPSGPPSAPDGVRPVLELPPLLFA